MDSPPKWAFRRLQRNQGLVLAISTQTDLMILVFPNPLEKDLKPLCRGRSFSKTPFPQKTVRKLFVCVSMV